MFVCVRGQHIIDVTRLPGPRVTFEVINCSVKIKITLVC